MCRFGVLSAAVDIIVLLMPTQIYVAWRCSIGDYLSVHVCCYFVIDFFINASVTLWTSIPGLSEEGKNGFTHMTGTKERNKIL